MLLQILVWFCLISSFYAYIGYPLLLRWLIQRSTFEHPEPSLDQREQPQDFRARVTVVVTVRNEKEVIREKIENTLQMTIQGKPAVEQGAQIIIASDASDDGTDDVVMEYAARGVELVRTETRGGKENAQRAAIEKSRGDILLFTDAKIKLKSDALERFIAYFRDPEIGAVSSIDRIEDTPGAGSGEGFYIKYEMWLRSLESQFQTLVGLSGSCFAVRRQVCRNLKTDIPSDFALLIETRRQGLRGVHAPDIVATYKSVSSSGAEFNRKVRTVLRGITTFFASREVMNPFQFGSFSWQIISHKLFRWLVPIFLGLAFLGTAVLAMNSCFYLLMLLGMLGFLALALLGHLSPKLRESSVFRAPLFFIVVNAGIAVAWWKFMSGQRSVQWTPSARSNNSAG